MEEEQRDLRLTKKYGLNQCDTVATQFVIAMSAPRLVRGRGTFVVSQGTCMLESVS